MRGLRKFSSQTEVGICEARTWVSGIVPIRNLVEQPTVSPKHQKNSFTFGPFFTSMGCKVTSGAGALLKPEAGVEKPVRMALAGCHALRM